MKKGQVKNVNILDKLFNDQTKFFLSKHGLRRGMSILDIGCGLGVMTQFLAKCVGDTGHVVAIDHSEEQIETAKKNCPKNLLNRITWHVADIYNLAGFEKQFDLVYCRFVLHNLNKPRAALSQIKNTLSPSGIYVGVEGIIDSAFSIPEHTAWRPDHLAQKVAGRASRDSNIGKILPALIRDANMDCKESSIYQPLLISPEDRQLLLYNKCIAIQQYQTEKSQIKLWKEKYEHLKSCVDNDRILMAFYSANFTASIKAEK